MNNNNNNNNNKSSIITQLNNKLAENHSQLVNINEQKRLSYGNFDHCNSAIQRELMRVASTSPNPFVSEQVISAYESRMQMHQRHYRALLDQPVTDTKAELTEIEMIERMVASKTNCTNFMWDILRNSDVDIDPNRRRVIEGLLQRNDTLIAQDAEVDERHKKLVSERIRLEDELSKSEGNGGRGSGSAGDTGSLVDDYADPSTEMPSYIDPED